MKFLIKLRTIPLLRYLSYFLMKLLGVEIPLSVQIGKNFILAHWGNGVVIHPFTIIKDNVKIYQGVTIGRADIYQNPNSEFNEIVIEDNVIISAGAKVLTSKNCVIASGTIIGANAVLLIKEAKIEKGVYVGNPARKIK